MKLVRLGKETQERLRGRMAGYGIMKAGTERDIWSAIRQAKLKPVSKAVIISFQWVEKDKRRDLDNIRSSAKFINDALVGAGILPDDGRKWVKELRDTYTIGKQPGVWVTIEEV